MNPAFRSAGAGSETLDHVLDIVCAHGPGLGEHFGKAVQFERDGRRCQCLLPEVGHGHPPRMAELYPEMHTLGPRHIGPRLVQLLQFPGRRLVDIRHVFFHRGLGDAVGDDFAVGHLQGFKGCGVIPEQGGLRLGELAHSKA